MKNNQITYNNKPNIILDLDQTIISGEPTEEYNFEKNMKKSIKFKFEIMENYYIIFQRPHLQKFLDFIFKNFNVSVWTAASKDYALFIIDRIILAGKKNRKLDYIFFSYHCNVSKKIKRKGTKNLTMLWDFYKINNYNKNNTVIIDDYKKDVYNKQKSNCILTPPFEFTDEFSDKDTFLKDLQNDLQNVLNNKENLNEEINKINKKNIEKYKL
jgi:hypothetical protein